MSEEDDLEQVMAAAMVANALKDGDFDALCELADVLNASCAKRKTADFVLGLIWELLLDEAHDKFLASEKSFRIAARRSPYLMRGVSR